MKIDKKGIEEIQNTIETPLSTLAKQMDEKGILDRQLAEIITFVLGNLQNIGSKSKQWEIVD
tara:strand:+ start:546 stop:731 length:186 start_codon:yes stop_codon:yes gene_type:complete